MALTYYDDALAKRLAGWAPTNTQLRILKPDETARLFETTDYDKSKEQPIQLPIIALSRNNEIELLQTTKSNSTFDGLKLVDENGDLIINTNDQVPLLNVIPVRLNYQLDIYAKTYDEADNYLREYLFALINNPKLSIYIPYNAGKTNLALKHTFNIRVASNIADTSSIPQRIFSGQFTRWTINLELQDTFLFSIPYRKNWRLYTDDGNLLDIKDDNGNQMLPIGVQVVNSMADSETDIEPIIETK